MIAPAPAAPLRSALSTLQIGTIVGRASLGGGERYYFDLLRTLPSQGVAVRGLIVGDPSRVERPVPGVDSFAPDGADRLTRWRGLRRSVGRRLGGSDLVVSHLAPHTFPVLDLIGARPFVVHFHHPIALAQWEEKGLRSRLEWLEEWAVYRRPARLIVLSRAFARTLARDYRVPEERIRVIPGGVDLRRFAALGSRAHARGVLGLPADRPIVVTVRRLVENKGLEELIGAVDLLRREVPDALLAIGGSGFLRDALEARVRALGLERWVRFLGYVDDDSLPLVYRAADLSIVPTAAWEGFGLVVVEALACGTPVLVTPVGGLPEVVTDLEPGLVLAGCGRATLAAGMIDALRGRLRLPDEAACTAYARRFDWPAIAGRISDVYREAL